MNIVFSLVWAKNLLDNREVHVMRQISRHFRDEIFPFYRRVCSISGGGGEYPHVGGEVILYRNTSQYNAIRQSLIELNHSQAAFRRPFYLHPTRLETKWSLPLTTRLVVTGSSKPLQQIDAPKLESLYFASGYSLEELTQMFPNLQEMSLSFLRMRTKESVVFGDVGEYPRLIEETTRNLETSLRDKVVPSMIAALQGTVVTKVSPHVLDLVCGRPVRVAHQGNKLSIQIQKVDKRLPQVITNAEKLDLPLCVFNGAFYHVEPERLKVLWLAGSPEKDALRDFSLKKYPNIETLRLRKLTWASSIVSTCPNLKHLIVGPGSTIDHPHLEILSINSTRLCPETRICGEVGSLHWRGPERRTGLNLRIEGRVKRLFVPSLTGISLGENGFIEEIFLKTTSRSWPVTTLTPSLTIHQEIWA